MSDDITPYERQAIREILRAYGLARPTMDAPLTRDESRRLAAIANSTRDGDTDVNGYA